MKNRNHYDSVVFDLDSTLVTIEGLDFLANIKGVGKKVSSYTKRAMDGDITMNEAMTKKIKILDPSYKDLEVMGKGYIDNLTEGAAETISTLKKHKINPWIITGNFQPAVGMLAKYVGVPQKNVITNKIYFNPDGSYNSFDEKNLLSNNGGKVKIIRKFKKLLGKVVYVGDGSTDLETKVIADLFIGFGGVVYRKKVEKNSKIYVTDKNLVSVLPYIIPNFNDH